jgi:hypothetical protein
MILTQSQNPPLAPLPTDWGLAPIPLRGITGLRRCEYINCFYRGGAETQRMADKESER